MNVNLAQMKNLCLKNILFEEKDTWLAKIVVLGGGGEVAWLIGKSGASGSSDLSLNPSEGKYLITITVYLVCSMAHRWRSDINP